MGVGGQRVKWKESEMGQSRGSAVDLLYRFLDVKEH